MRIAVMLDLDNFLPDLEAVQNSLRKHGTLELRRAFATNPRLRWFYGDQLRTYGYRLELAPSHIRHWQEVDRLIIESALELRDHYDVLALGSHDQDYIPLLQRLSWLGKLTIVLGQDVPKRLRRVAHQVVPLPRRGAPRDPKDPRPTPLGLLGSILNRALHRVAPHSWRDFGEIAGKLAPAFIAEASPNGDLALLVTTVRSRHGWSRAELAAALEVTPRTVARWETGLTRPSSAKVEALLQAFHGRPLGSHA